MAPGLMIYMTTGRLTDLDVESDRQGQGQVLPPHPDNLMMHILLLMGAL